VGVQSSYPDFVGDTNRLDQALLRISDGLKDRRTEFLFGAGMSKESDLPIGGELLVKLLNNFFPSFGDNPPDEARLQELEGAFPFEAIMEAIENMPGGKREDLTQALKALLIDPQPEPAQAHHDFLSVCLWGARPRLHNVFTTNYDSLLEDVMGKALSVPITERNAKQMREAHDSGKICVIHLHGMIEDGDYKITESDLYTKTYSVLAGEFRNALTADAFVFVGYSMNDPDFRDLYMQHRREIIDRKRVDRDTYVVGPARNEHEYQLGKAIWDARGAVWIPLGAGAFFSKLKTIVTTRVEDRIRTEVMRKFDVKDDAALADFLARTSKLLRVDNDEALVFLHDMRKPTGGRR